MARDPQSVNSETNGVKEVKVYVSFEELIQLQLNEINNKLDSVIDKLELKEEE